MHRPRIGIIGTGAIGGFCGFMLARIGHDVHFLLHSDYGTVVEDSLHLHSAVHGQMHLRSAQAWDGATKMPQCNWLFIGAKTTSNVVLVPIIAQLSAPRARVVPLQNGLAVEDQLHPLLPANLHLLGVICFICTHRSGGD